MKPKRYPPIFQSVPADEFTDREEIIGMLVERATNTPRDMTLSASIVGQRRLGKTAVMEQVYNRLFWEQDEVVPIYFNFEAQPTTSTEFAWAYFTNFLKQYVAFRLKDSDLARLEDRNVELKNLVALAESLSGDPITNYADKMVRLLSSPTVLLHDKLEWAIYLPRRVMEYNRGRWKPETPIFVMLDEFQNILLINYSDGKPARMTGLYQWAVEGRQCPHFVIGSAVRLINQEVLGTGALFGRFRYIEFPPMEDVYGLELVDKIFFNLKDPLLRDFINTQYELDVEGEPLTRVLEDLAREHKKLKGKHADLVGALVEARIEALLNRFDGRTVPGRLFHTEGKVQLPRFHAVADTKVKPPGEREYQIDLQGRWRKEYDIWAWVVEIKHWKKRVTADVVTKFVVAYTALAQETKLDGTVKWMVNQGGFTKGAIEALEQHSIYYSGAAEINELLRAFGIERLLPEEAEAEQSS